VLHGLIYESLHWDTIDDIIVVSDYLAQVFLCSPRGWAVSIFQI